jgi:hypothetical protein
MRKIAYLLGSAVAVLGLALAGASAAMASSALVHGGSVKPLATVASHYSVPLAGYVVQGNGLQPYSDVRSDVVNLPDPSSAVEADTLAVGVAMGENFSTGGQVFGVGAVWDDPSSACLSDQYTVEDGAAFDPSSPLPVPVSDLNPVLDGGSQICLNPGDSFWFEIYHSTGLHEIDVIVGPTESDSDVVTTFTHLGPFPIAQDFRDPAIGLTTTTGQSENIPTGTTFTFGGEGQGGVGNGLTLIENNKIGAHQERVTLANQNLGDYIATVNGAAPSVANPQTLTPSGFGSGSSFSVDVP